jgi:hypothetical protein
MSLQTKITWWIPGGSLVYKGTAKTRVEWVRLTWRGYVAYWHLIFLVLWKLLKFNI